MEKICFFDEVIFKKKENDSAQSTVKIAETHYFEVHLKQGQELCIKLESEESQIIYHNPSAMISNIKKVGAHDDKDGQRNIQEVKHLQHGNILGFVCSFFDREDEKGYSLCQFLHNGEPIGIAMRMNGTTVTPMVFINPATTTVNSSLEFGKSKVKEGKISIN